MVVPLQELLGNMYCLEGAPLFCICTAWFVTFPVAAATGLDMLCTSGSAFTGRTQTKR